jgi:uncharacterized membrane protein YdjX (TVP38/TMEM64 family)
MRKNIIIPFIIIVSVIIVSFFLFDDLEIFFKNLLRRAGSDHTTYALFSFFVLMSDIILPVPSSIIMFTNGYVLGTAYGTAISLLSLSAGAIVGYYLGRFTSLGLRSGADDKANSILSVYGPLSILITRGIPVLSETICIICGFNKMPFKKYLIYNIIGYFPLCLLYAFCGSIGYDKNIFLVSFGCSIFIAATFWFFGRKLLTGRQAGSN